MNKLSDNGLIHAQDLYYLLGGPEKIKLLDATYSGSGFQSFLARHINGAQYFDIDVVADQNAPLPHTIPSPEYFESCMSAFGISNDDHVVIYDQSGAYMASSRAWWLFRLFGHENVYVLEGGLQQWIMQGFAVSAGPIDSPAPSTFKAKYNPGLVVTKSDLLNNLKSAEITVVDARPTDRFFGRAPEPRESMRAGHIPGSINLPFMDVLNPQDRLFKSDTDIEEILSTSFVSKDDKVAVSCGSGVTACTLALAIFKARGQNAAVYDGSWTEWGDENADTPIEVSA